MLKIVEATPLQIGDMRIIPRAHVARGSRDKAPWLWWARPADVVIETADSTRVLPIPDPTRSVVLACAALSILAVLWTVLSSLAPHKEME